MFNKFFKVYGVYCFCRFVWRFEEVALEKLNELIKKEIEKTKQDNEQEKEFVKFIVEEQNYIRESK